MRRFRTGQVTIESPAAQPLAGTAIVGTAVIRPIQLALGVAVTIAMLGGPSPDATAPYCRPGQVPAYDFGFANLSAALGPRMGDPIECEHVDAATGDTVQRTTAGRAYYRPATNVAAFTDGTVHRAWTARGLVAWTGDSTDPPGVTVTGAVAAIPEGLALPAVNLDSIFGAGQPDLSELDPDRLHTLVFTGDIGLVRMVNVTTVTSGDFVWPFRETVEILKGADLTVANLEGPLVAGCELRYSSLEFCGDPRNVAGLQYAGFDLVGLGNNHIYDHGQTGLDSTRDLLEGAGIDHTGNGIASIQVVGGVRFGFLAFNMLWSYDPEAMAEEIAALRVGVDVVVVIMHWGAEYTDVPLAPPGTPNAPRDIARGAVAAGADLVLGNHPHRVQAVELIDGVLVAYAHGNFIFDQRWSLETLQGVIGRYTFYDGTLVAVVYLPVHIEEWGQPRPAEAVEAGSILQRMRRASESLLPD